MFRVLTGGANNAGLQVETDSTGVKNGLFLDSDGEIRYYEDGSITRSGLIYVNGYYYYIRSSGVAARNTSYWVTNNNGLMESTTYHFDAYGRMIDPPDGSYIADVGGTGMRVDYTYDADGLRKTKTVTTGELFSIPRDGLHWDEDGELRYYRNGYLTRVGLIYVDGHYYYIKSDGTAVRNQEYWISHNNGLLPNQDYIFNEYGWLTNPESDKEIEVKMSTNNAVSADMYFDWTLNPGTATSVTYTYTYNGGTLAQMTGGGDTLSFSYDASGKPMAVTWGTTTYLYLTNLQGDVIAILDTAGNQVVQYTYDAWGNILTTTGTLANTLGTLNPITYRGYIYDTETDLYYLQSRYYNPAIGRFLNADAFVATGQGFIGNNMFAHCLNNPANLLDASGMISYTCMGDNPYFEIFRAGSRGIGGSGGTVLGISSLTNRKQKGFEFSDQLSKTTNHGQLADFTERVFALDITGGSFSVQDGLSLINIEGTILEGTYDFGNVELSSKMGTAEANTTIKINEFDVGISASIWEPSAIVQIGKIMVAIEVPVGTVGVALRAMPREFSFTAIAWGLSVAWEEIE